MHRLLLSFTAAFVGFAICVEAQTMTRTPGTFYVSPKGSDEWSGMLPEPTADGTDGPFASVQQAQWALRAMDRTLKRQVVLRAGTYYLDEPLSLTAEDSGSKESPVVYTAAPGEKVIISGGRAIEGWKKGDDGLWHAPVPEAKSGAWDFRQLRVGDEAQRLARYPNYDPKEPTKGGWLFARSETDHAAWFTTVANIHNAGDFIRWEMDVPADGSYRVWFYYGQLMKPHGRDNNNGQMTVRVDDGEEVWLDNLPDTGGWGTCTWSLCATVTLAKGKHSLTWTNRKGGGINLNAIALCSDQGWQPVGIEPPAMAQGSHLIVVQAQDYVEAKGREMKTMQGSGFAAKKDELPFGKGDIPDWDLAGAQIQLFPAWGWVGGKVQIGGIDRENGILKLTGQNAQQEVRLGNRYCLENVREALDEAGEFYLDKMAGELLYKPARSDFAKQGVVAPKLDRLIHIQGSGDSWPEFIRFENLEFRDAKYSLAVDSLYTPDDAAVWIDQAREIDIDNCVFTLLGGYGVKFLNRSRACTVTRCHMFELGQGGVIARGDDATKPEDCTVAGCHMHDLGRFYQHVGGVYVTCGDGFRVSHCDIHDVPRYAISFKSYGGKGNSHRCIAEYNDIRRTNLETNDTGAIETLGRDHALTGTIIRYNLILDTIGMKHTPDGKLLSPFYTWGIYLDDYSSGMQIYGNIVARNFRGGYHNHLGFDNIVENNVFVDGYNQQAEWNGRADMRRNTFTNNIVAYRYPEAAYLRSGGWNPTVLKECDRNVIWWQGGDLTKAEKPTPAGTWQKWQELGFDENSVLADPQFVDAAKDDYRLKPTSPAWGLGFKRIPVERIGTKGYAPGE
jgi:hypothetical protein